jgi:hypothetical protein
MAMPTISQSGTQDLTQVFIPICASMIWFRGP